MYYTTRETSVFTVIIIHSRNYTTRETSVFTVIIILS